MAVEQKSQQGAYHRPIDQVYNYVVIVMLGSLYGKYVRFNYIIIQRVNYGDKKFTG